MSYQVQSTSSQTQAQVSQMQQDLRVAMYNLSKDIRNVGCRRNIGTVITSGPDGISQIVATSNSSGLNRLTLYTDITGDPEGSPDGDSNDPGEHVLYRLNGTDLQRFDFNDGGKILQIAQNVQVFELRYYSHDPATNTFNEIAALAGNEEDVRLIKIKMTVRSSQPDPDSGNYLTRTLERRIKPRNIKEYN
jgi:type II secretory pathway component PulJ